MVIAIVTLLVTLLLPALARERPRSQAAVCLNNAKQLVHAWLMYADDNADRLPGNTADPFQSGEWVYGLMREVPGGIGLPATATNTALLKQGVLWSYVKSFEVYQCPANPLPMVRGYSMNGFMGATNSADNDANNFGHYLKLSQVIRPNLRFVTMEEDPNSINDGYFRARMSLPLLGAGFLKDWPGGSHNRSGGFSFADGHAELHRWKNFGPAPANYLYNMTVPISSDLLYLMKGSTDSKQGWW